jgi:hypothetical protein
MRYKYNFESNKWIGEVNSLRVFRFVNGTVYSYSTYFSSSSQKFLKDLFWNRLSKIDTIYLSSKCRMEQVDLDMLKFLCIKHPDHDPLPLIR